MEEEIENQISRNIHHWRLTKQVERSSVELAD